MDKKYELPINYKKATPKIFDFNGPCQHGNHVWVWSSKSVLDDAPPLDSHRCQCGLVKWKDRDKNG